MDSSPARISVIARARQVTLWIPGVITGALTTISLLFLLVALLVGCGSGGPAMATLGPSLLVTSFSPVGGGQGRGDTALRVRFNAPVVDHGQVGQTLAQAPVSISPPLRVAASWSDRQTLVLKPLSRLRPSTHYRVALTSGVARRVKGETRFSFVHRPLSVQRLAGLDHSGRIRPTRPLVLHLDQPVLAGEVARGCELLPEAGGAPMALSVPDPELVANAVHLRPARPLARDAAYTLRCVELRGHGGNVGLPQPYQARLRTLARFKVLQWGPRSGNIPSDEVPVTLRFSTPVALAAVRRALTIRPWARGLRRGTLDSTRTRYTALLDLKTTTGYTVQLSRALRDSSGQRLARGQRWSFTTSDASARLTMQRGIYALEPGQGGYPVWSRNVHQFELACARVPRRRVVRLLTSGMNYDPWYSSTADKDLRWRKLGLRLQRRKLRVPKARNKWRLTRLKLARLCGGGARPGGLYLAEVRTDEVKPRRRSYRYRPRQRVLANVTDLGVMLKVGPASGLVWVTGINSGEPVSGARVTVYTLRGREAHVTTTNSQGIARLPGSARLLRQPGAHDKNALEQGQFADDYDIYRSQRLIVTVDKGGDMAVVDGNWANGIQIWNFGVPADRSGGRARIRGLIQSDRGIYRPGERVNFKGLLREIRAGQPPQVPRQRRVQVHVTNSRNATVLRRRLRLSSFGGFSFKLQLAQSAPLGDYRVSATIAGQTVRERFTVEEFRKVSFELRFRGHERHARGGKHRIKLQARYLFGAPVNSARVRWSVQRRDHRLRPARFPQYTFTDQANRGRYYWWDRRQRHPRFVTDGEGETDDQGRLSMEFNAAASGQAGPQDFLVQATVKDQTDQSVSKRAVVTAHPTDIYLGLHAQEYVQAVGMPFAINTVAISPGGRQVAGRGKLTLTRVQYVCQDRRSGRYRSYRSCKRRHQRALSRRVRLPATGNGVERVLLTRPGEYMARLSGRDSRGREVAASTHVWVIGQGQAFWSGDESARLALVAGKRVYRPGDTARLAALNGLGRSTALVTLERGGVLDAFVTTLQSSGQGLHVPLGTRHAPNVYASVAMVRGRTGPGDRARPRFKLGVVELRVATDHQRLQVQVQTERARYEPGQQVRGTLSVTDAKGKPVAAEVSLSAADEGLLALVAYRTPDPMAHFYKPWGLGVDASTNLNRVARLNDPLANDPDGGGDSGGDGEQPVRSRFVNSAFWAPALLTNAAGRASFSFKAPDNLTAFRLMAVAADRGSRFGSAQGRLTVTKPLLAKPVLPRFFAAGDRTEVGLVVHNYTGRAGRATVTVRASGLTLDRRQASVRLSSRGSARVRFGATVGMERQARVRFSVRMGRGSRRHSDALELTLPVRRQMVVERTTLASGEVNGRAEVALSWPQDLLPADSRLEVSVDRTGLSELGPSLRYLVRYPYGCLEQTLSGFIPLTKVQDLARSLSLQELRGPRLQGFIRAGVAKVIRHQHDTGQFSLWPGSQTYPHLTTYAMYGLAEARKAGVRVDRGALDRGLRAVRAWATSSQRLLTPGGELANMALAAYVMAALGAADPGLNARLYEAREGMPRYGQAFLLRAMKRAGASAPQLRVLRDGLLQAVRPGAAPLVRETFGGKATFDSVHWYMSSDVRSTAITLSALLEADPKNPAVGRLVRGLLKARRKDGRWYNTQDNIYSLVALSDFARTRAAGRATVTLALNGKRLARGKLKGSRVLTLARPLSRLAPGKLVISANAGSRPRYTVRLVQARQAVAQGALDRGFTVTRAYLDPQTGAALSSFKAGQLVKVRLTVKTPRRRVYVALSDPLPAGFEAVNSRLATSSATRHRGRQRWRRGRYGRYVWSHKELRDDRVLAFADRMPAGSYTLEYRARATIPGRFTAAPAQAEAMYQPDVLGRTAVAQVEVAR